jgi:dipeptidyl aminopeptidase/acylaminoacyl peptidase
MNYFYSFTQIPLYAWLMIIGLSLGLLALIAVSRCRQKDVAKPLTEDVTTPRWKHILIKTLRLTAFALFSLVVIGATLMLVMNYQATIDETTPAPSQVEIPDDLPFELEEVIFLSPDGLRISGWFVPPKNGVTVILLHGYGSNRLGMRWHAERLVEAGYGVLMYDERASGESEGDYRSYGWEDERDVGGAVAFLNNRPEVDPTRIGIGGCSIGGQIALQGAAYHPEIKAVWADGAAIIRAVDNVPPKNLIMWLVNMGNYMIDWQYQRVLEIEAPSSMIEIIDDIAPRPIMLVAGGVERPFLGNEAQEAFRFAQYAGDNAEVWVIEEAYHCDGPTKRPDEYTERMIQFFDDAFAVAR